MKVKCDKCDGSGEMDCSCRRRDWIKIIYDRGNSHRYEMEGLQRCRECGQNYSVIIQYDVGTGHDDKIKPITQEEADKY